MVMKSLKMVIKSFKSPYLAGFFVCGLSYIKVAVEQIIIKSNVASGEVTSHYLYFGSSNSSF
jgi:hypothetical protein